ncbi:conserved hypothetical protein [Ricinus communis]|uniref:Uncharacterized protein n=1 Tax=Ricinus communis TaxID=3988 RepID=B9RZJ2_RICCO|nr:conserved hypothetical protein [Ricinus communis]
MLVEKGRQCRALYDDLPMPFDRFDFIDFHIVRSRVGDKTYLTDVLGQLISFRDLDEANIMESSCQ